METAKKIIFLNVKYFWKLTMKKAKEYFWKLTMEINKEKYFWNITMKTAKKKNIFES